MHQIHNVERNWWQVDCNLPAPRAIEAAKHPTGMGQPRTSWPSNRQASEEFALEQAAFSLKSLSFWPHPYFPLHLFFLFILSSTYILLDSPCLNVLGLLQCLVLQERYLQEAWTAQRCWDPQMNKLLSGQLPEILKNMHNLFPVWSIFFRCQATPLSQA